MINLPPTEIVIITNRNDHRDLSLDFHLHCEDYPLPDKIIDAVSVYSIKKEDHLPPYRITFPGGPGYGDY